MFALRALEVHVTHACNLFCESCSHYSNQGHTGNLDLLEAESWFRDWGARLRPKRFTLMGGEPTLHPRLVEFFPLARRYFPHSELQLVTNGFFLHRHPDIETILRQDRRVRVEVSIHYDSAEYMDRLKPALELLGRWRKEFGGRITLRPSIRSWTRRYRGLGAGMLPFEDEDVRASWEACTCRHCPQLFRGALWKCPPLAYLPLQAEKYGLGPEWDPYLAYRPLQPSATEEELHAFLAREEEAACGMCTAARRSFRPADPLRPERITQD